MAVQTYLLDTSVLVAYIRGSSREATQWIVRSVNDANIRCAVSSLTYFEFWLGATDRIKVRQYKIIFNKLKVFAITKDIANIGANFYLHLPKNQREDKIKSDILIAATAESHRLSLVTINRKHFSRFPLTVKAIYI